MRILLQDSIFAFRQLRKSPGFALAAILSLALGIGAATAVFSVIYGVLMNPYPYKDPDRMVHLVLRDNAGNKRWPGLTGPQIRQVRLAGSVESLAAEDDWSLTTTDEDLPEDAAAVYLTPNATTHFGVPAMLGRGFMPSDAPDGQDPQQVVVLSHKFWLRHYGARPDVLGRTLRLVHKSYTIVGVMPARFTWGDADVYLPLKLTEDPKREYSAFLRLKPGVSRAAANSELQALLQQFAKDAPSQFPLKFRVALQGLNEQFVERLGPTLFLLFGAVGLLLAIGCANVSILLLARGTARRHELTVRAAMGAGRGRILRQLLTESLQLSVAGAALGVVLAYQGVHLIVKWLPENSFPHEAAIRINLPVLIFSVVLALGTGVLFGLSPALHLSRPDLAGVMQASSRRMTAGVRGKRLHGALVAAQVALTMLLLASAGGAIRGFVRLMHTELGYDPHNTMSVGIPVHENTYTTWEKRSQYFEQLRQRVAAMPAVISAGISTNATPPDNGWNTHFEILGQPVPEERELRVNVVSPEYFTVLRIPLLQGRIFDHTETMHGARQALVNQTMAHQYWRLGEAVGQQIRVPQLKSEPPFAPAAPESDGWLQVVGVVADARDDGLREAVKPAIYIPYTLKMPMYTQILVRTRGEPLSVLRAVRAQVQAVNPDQQVMGRVRNLEQWIETQPEWAQERLVATLFGAFAILALVLAVFGLYSVVSYIVVQRTNEFGIRMALGAGRTHVLHLVFASTALSVGGGLVAGLALSLALKGMLSRWAQGSSMDAAVLLAVAGLFMTTAAIGCMLPAYRASSIDPVKALRYE
jgi:putative ABC transport system permease protein